MVRHGLGVLLILGVGVASALVAWKDARGLVRAWQTHAPRLTIGPAMLYGVIVSALLAIIAGAVFYANILGRPVSPAMTRAMQWSLAVLGVCLIVILPLAHVWLDGELKSAGYRSCGVESWHRFRSVEWTRPPAVCDPE